MQPAVAGGDVSQPVYGRFDMWQGIATVDVERAREICARLELRARSEDEVAARAAYLDLLAVAPGERVLDVGCGSGVVTRAVARRVAPDGMAVGLDPSPALLTVAHGLAEQDGVGDLVDLREGDARSLPFGDAEFDVVLAVTSLSHIPDGKQAIPELVRVARGGGRVGVFDRDTDSFIIAHPDRDTTRRIVTAFSDHRSMDGWLARRLLGRLTEAGLQDVRVRAFTSIERDASGFFAMGALRAAETAVLAGAITEEERQRWVEALREEQAAGRFIVGMTHLFVWGIRLA
jgi:ubiquinone/menaquinone biosynthesis C-methylase UbiE